MVGVYPSLSSTYNAYFLLVCLTMGSGVLAATRGGNAGSYKLETLLHYCSPLSTRLPWTFI
jgi:hypothetical protein